MAVAIYVYRLVVTLPEGSTERGWEPDNWVAFCDDRGWSPVNDERDETSFAWALSRKHYLSGGAANRRANLLRGFGATVEVERSESVVWS